MEHWNEVLNLVRRNEIMTRLLDWVFGYDFFISYSQGDGLNYPRQLREKLELVGFRVFLDQVDYVAGMELLRETGRQVSKSRNFVVIGRPLALVSGWVSREVEEALARGKVPVVIEINGAVRNASDSARVAQLAREHEWLRIAESLDQADGVPSDRTVGELVRGFGHLRQQQKRQRVAVALLAVFVVLSGLAVWQAIVADNQRAVAEYNLEVARGTADGLVIDIARGLRDVEGMRIESLRKILSRAEATYDKLSASAPDDRASQRSRATMYNEFVETYLANGDTESARVAARRSVSLAEGIAGAASAGTDERSLLARSLLKLGDASAEVGHRKEARDAYERALSIRTSLATEQPGDAVAQRDVAVALTRLGQLAEIEDNLPRARDQHLRSLAIRQSLVVRRPEWRRDVVVAQISLGDVLLSLNEHLAANNAFDGAVENATLLRDADPTSTRALRDLAVAHQRRGNSALGEGDLPGAKSAFEMSRQQFSKLSDLDPGNIEWRRDVGIASAKLANVERAAGNLAIARSVLLDIVMLRRGLATASEANVLYMTDLIEAIKDLATISCPKEAEPLWREVGDQLSVLARTGSLTSEQQSWAALAASPPAPPDVAACLAAP